MEVAAEVTSSMHSLWLSETSLASAERSMSGFPLRHILLNK